MAFLPDKPISLTGGCFCSAIRYTIDIPALSQRQELPGALPTPIDKKGNSVPSRLPLIDIDHCQSCRRACGSIVQVWVIARHDWISFKLQSRDHERAGSYLKPFSETEAQSYMTGHVALLTKQVLDSSYVGTYESSSKVQRTFCTRCGTPVTYAFAGDRGPNWTLGPIVDIAAGTLDSDSFEQIRPERHGWWEDGTEWVKKLMREGDGGVLIRHPAGKVNSKIED